MTNADCQLGILGRLLPSLRVSQTLAILETGMTSFKK